MILKYNKQGGNKPSGYFVKSIKESENSSIFRTKIIFLVPKKELFV